MKRRLGFPSPADAAAALRAVYADTPSPKRAAFVDALNARGTDRRTRRYKHFDKVVDWMSDNWATDLNFRRDDHDPDDDRVQSREFDSTPRSDR